MSFISQKIVKSQLRRRLLKAASKLGLHYFLWRLKSPMAVKGLTFYMHKVRLGKGNHYLRSLSFRSIGLATQIGEKRKLHACLFIIVLCIYVVKVKILLILT